MTTIRNVNSKAIAAWGAETESQGRVREARAFEPGSKESWGDCRSLVLLTLTCPGRDAS